MAKYRRLDPEELKELETNFVRFLAVNGIPGEDWEKIKTSDPARVDELIDQFSDLIFEQTLGELEYLEFKTPNDIKTFKFLDEKVHMLGIFVEGNTEVDFTQPGNPIEMIDALRKAGARLKLYQAEKKYTDGKKAEAFKMMENGALISKDGQLYKTFDQLIQG